MSEEMKASQIEAAQNLGSMLSSLGTIEDDKHRINYAYNQVCERIRNICEQHQTGGKPCFDSKQIECIAHISFQLFSILDSKIKPPPPPTSTLEALEREWGALSVLGKLKSFKGTLAAIVTIIGLVEAGRALWNWRTSDPPQITKKSE